MKFLSKKRQKKYLSGFTIVELLVVIVVIAILAAIAIVAYNNIIPRAHEASVRSDTGQSAKKLIVYQQTDGLFPADCTTAGVKVSSGNTLKCNVSSDSQSFCVAVSYRQTSFFSTNIDLTPKSGICSGFTGVAVGSEHTAVSTRALDHTCSIKGGKAFCWGDNTDGQLGNGVTSTESTIPVAVSTAGVLAGKTITKIATGSAGTSCAISDGAVYCWGNGADGKLGNGIVANSNVPVAVNMSGAMAGMTATDVQIGIGHVCAIANAQLFCWGYNYTSGSSSNFGVTTPGSSSVPVLVSNSGLLAGKTITKLSLDGYGGPNCVIANGAPYCWGFGVTGGLGNGANLSSTIPVAVTTSGALSGKTITDISTYEYHSCAVASGAAYCWGGNGSAQLGKGDSGNPTSTNVPVAVTASGVLAGKTVTAISVGDYFSCAIADGKAYCWGDNIYGTLGDGSSTAVDALTPVAVSVANVLANKTVTSISAGYGNVCVIADSLTHCWGVNWSGSLGNGNSTQSGIPVLSQL